MDSWSLNLQFIYAYIHFQTFHTYITVADPGGGGAQGAIAPLGTAIAQVISNIARPELTFALNFSQNILVIKLCVCFGISQGFHTVIHPQHPPLVCPCFERHSRLTSKIS